MGNFFEVLSRQEGLAATYIPQMLVDHPVTTDRIAEARSRAAPISAAQGERTLSATRSCVSVVRVLTAPGDTDIEKVYAQEAREDSERYGHPLRGGPSR